VVEWMAVTGLPHNPRVGDMTEALRAAGVGPGMVNTGQSGDIPMLQELVPAAIAAARTHLEARRAAYDAKVNEPIEKYRARLATWKQLSLDVLLVQAQPQTRRDEVQVTAGRLDDLTNSLRTAGEPLLRLLAVIAPAMAADREEVR
jgi:hypothetical protein